MFSYMNNEFDEKNTNIVESSVMSLEFENSVKNSVESVCNSECDGIVYGNATYVDGIQGKAIRISNASDSWVEIPHNKNLNFDHGGVTLSFWVMIHTNDMRHNMIYNKGEVGWGSTYKNSINGLYEGDIREFQALWTGNNVNQYLNIHCNDGKEIQLEKWYFITHVLENDQQTLRQYINGKEFCHATSIAKVFFDNENSFHLGRVIGTYDDNSDLTLDNFHLFSYSLTGEQIEDLYQNESRQKIK